MLSLYRTLIGLRNANPALNIGRVEGVASSGKVLRYERFDGYQRFAILLNLSESTEDVVSAAGHIVASTHMDRDGEVVQSSLSLRPFEGVIVELVN